MDRNNLTALLAALAVVPLYFKEPPHPAPVEWEYATLRHFTVEENTDDWTSRVELSRPGYPVDPLLQLRRLPKHGSLSISDSELESFMAIYMESDAFRSSGIAVEEDFLSMELYTAEGDRDISDICDDLCNIYETCSSRALQSLGRSGWEVFQTDSPGQIMASQCARTDPFDSRQRDARVYHLRRNTTL